MNIDMSIFDGNNKFVINKPIRLIELFAGYGSQALALKYLGVPFEHWRISEWAIKSIQAYKDAHFPDDNRDYSVVRNDAEIRSFFKGGRISADYNVPVTDEKIDKMKIGDLRKIYNNMIATNNRGSIVRLTGADLRVINTDEYNYIMCYSFPCQDLSNAGLGKGMERGSGTRSGMLWEVERLLFECNKLGELPQVLLMENVPEVIGEKNVPAFKDWLSSLESLGYKNYWKVLNATGFRIPQNRRRCFMVSVLGDHYYDMPEPIGCDKRLKHVLEKEVSENYYLSEETVSSFVKWSDRNAENGNGFGFHPTGGEGVGGAILTKAGSRGCDNFIDTYALSNRDDPKKTDCAITLTATDYKCCSTLRHQPINTVVEHGQDSSSTDR